MDIIPSFYQTRDMGETQSFVNGIGNNYLLRVGEIKKIIHPEDAGNINGKFVEYDVYVQHTENGTAQGRMYHNCCFLSSFGSLADKTFATLRVEKQALEDKAAFGAKVLLLCINGDTFSPVILGGVRDTTDSDIGEKAKGHHSYFVFNGVKFSINDDGSWQLEQQGPTDIKGDPDFSNSKIHPDGSKSAVKEADVGTVVKVESNGNLTISTNGGKEQVLVNHQDGSITLKGSRINLGSTQADQQVVLGNKWLTLMEGIIDAVVSITVPTPSGPSGVPINSPQFIKLKKQLSQVLSDFVYTQKAP